VRPAVWPRDGRRETRLLHADPHTGALLDRWITDLPGSLRAGDLLVVNDAATLPASLRGRTAGGAEVELRLAAATSSVREWWGVLFGGGTWRQRTEDRPAAPELGPGSTLGFGGQLAATIEAVSPISPRLVLLRFDREGADFWAALYQVGRPVQYSYLAGPLPLWQIQTAHAARPWALEMPSAGRPLDTGTFDELRRHGVSIASLTHAAGLSSTGDSSLDAALPLPERYEIPVATAAAVGRTRAHGGRVVAVGTSVVRALEDAARAGRGRVGPGHGLATLRIGAATRLFAVDGLLTGLHSPGTSHFELLQAFAPAALWATAHRHASAGGYLDHEFGDVGLLLAA